MIFLFYTQDGRITVNKTVPSSFEAILDRIQQYRSSLDNNDNNDKGGGKSSDGGLYKPANCVPDCTTAIIIPYKNREAQLKVCVFTRSFIFSYF